MILKQAKRLGVIVLWIMCYCPGLIWAKDSPQSYRFDLLECIERALRVNPKMEEARLDVDEAKVKLKSAKLERTGKWELFNRFGIAQDAEGDAITGDDISGEFGPFNRLNLAISVPLYTFGRLTHGINAANENVNRQRASQFKTTSEVILEVHKRYDSLVLTRQLLETTQNIKNNFDTAYELAEERLDKGDPQVTETDALKLRIGLAVIKGNLYTIQRQVRTAKAALREIMRIDDRIDFNIADEKLKPIEFNLEPLERNLALAEENNPDIGQLKAALAAEQARYWSEKSKFYPTLLALGGVQHGVAPGRENQDNPFLNDDFNFLNAGASFGIRWDLNFLQTDSGVQEKKVRYLRMKSRLQKALDGIALKVKAKYHQYIERNNSMEASFEAKKAGRALLFLNFTNFKMGMGSGRDVFDAVSLHARVDGDYYQAIFNYNTAVIELLDVVGNLVPYVTKEQ